MIARMRTYIGIGIIMATVGALLPLVTQSSDDNHPDSAWRTATFSDQHGKNVQMSDLLGKPTILSFAFTGCSAYCPAQQMSLAFLQEELTSSIGASNFQILSVSLTSLFDKPADMLRFSKRFHPEYENWSFLTGNKPMIDEMIDETGTLVKDFSTETYGDVNHTTDVYLFDKNGNLHANVVGLPLDKDHLATLVRELVNTDHTSLAQAL